MGLIDITTRPEDPDLRRAFERARLAWSKSQLRPKTRTTRIEESQPDEGDDEPRVIVEPGTGVQP